MKTVSLLPLCTLLLAAAPASAEELVRVAPFDSVELEGGGHVIVRHGDVQAVRLLRGSTALTRFVVDGSGKLRIEACNNDCPHHYDLEVEITTPHIGGLAISGGGAIDSAGNFSSRRLALAVDGGGTIDTRTMDVDRAEAAVEGGGVIRLRANGELTAAVNGGGDIRYWGNPRVTQAIDGGGEIKRGD
jgi:Putative auto-transporter adhesin, head GIN domain